MHVLIIAHSYPSAKYKKNSIFAFDQALALQKIGCDVTYFALDMRSVFRWRKWGVELKNNDNLSMYIFNFPGGRIIPSNILNKMRRFGIMKLFDKALPNVGMPDIIHAHFTEPGYAAIELKNKYGIPLIVTEHSSKINQPIIEQYIKVVAETTYNNADTLITVSRHLKENINKIFGIQSTVIPNIVDTRSFAFKEYVKNDSSYNFVSTGSLNKNKNMDILIKSFNKAFKNNKTVKLFIFGDGPERDRLSQMIYEYNLNDQIFLMGLVERKRIAYQMKLSDCFVLVSKLETFGVAFIEALSMGLPVIASRSGGPQDFINSENGILVNADSVDEVANALIEMHKESKNYDKKTISKDIVSKYSPEKIAVNLIEVYKNTIQGKIMK